MHVVEELNECMLWFLRLLVLFLTSIIGLGTVPETDGKDERTQNIQVTCTQSDKISTRLFRGGRDISCQHTAMLERAKRRTLRMTLSIIVAFIACWSPFVLVATMKFVFPSMVSKMFPTWLLEWFEIFTVTNSVANPLVYGLHSLSYSECFSATPAVQSVNHRKQDTNELAQIDSNNSLPRTTASISNVKQTPNITCIREHSV